jgi:hypothetical protein
VSLYEYRAEVLRVVDGDTIWLTWKDYGDGYAEVSKYEDGAMYEGLGYPREGE